MAKSLNEPEKSFAGQPGSNFKFQKVPNAFSAQ